ncbi:MAG: hypothetical protein QW735_04280 [archaeon]
MENKLENVRKSLYKIINMTIDELFNLILQSGKESCFVLLKLDENFKLPEKYKPLEYRDIFIIGDFKGEEFGREYRKFFHKACCIGIFDNISEIKKKDRNKDREFREKAIETIVENTMRVLRRLIEFNDKD